MVHRNGYNNCWDKKGYQGVIRKLIFRRENMKFAYLQKNILILQLMYFTDLTAKNIFTLEICLNLRKVAPTKTGESQRKV